MNQPSKLLTASDECFRCGYDLRSIADEQPCPECGLLARRSRRPSDELHVSRPRWLRRMSRGIALMLITLPCTIAWPFVWEFTLDWCTRQRFPIVNGVVKRAPYSLMVDVIEKCAWYGAFVITVMFVIGAVLVTSREGFEAADRADRARRIWIRWLSIVPTLGFGVIILTPFHRQFALVEHVAATLLTAGCAPLPVLIFYQLRSVAKRARSPRLAEHCAITGIGAGAALLVACATYWTFDVISRHDANWAGRSSAALIAIVIPLVAGALFSLWAMYLLVRLSITFGRASRRLRREWQSDDRSLELSDVAPTA